MSEIKPENTLILEPIESPLLDAIYNGILWKLSAKLSKTQCVSLATRISRITDTIKSTRKHVQNLEKIRAMLSDLLSKPPGGHYSERPSRRTLIINTQLLDEMLGIDVGCLNLFIICMGRLLEILEFCKNFMNSVGCLGSVYFEKVLLHQLLSEEYLSFEDVDTVPKFEISISDLQRCDLWCDVCKNVPVDLVLSHTLSLTYDCINSREKLHKRWLISSPLTHKLCEIIEILCDNQIVDIVSVFDTGSTSKEDCHTVHSGVHLETHLGIDHICPRTILSKSVLSGKLPELMDNLPEPYKEILFGDHPPAETLDQNGSSHSITLPENYWQRISKHNTESIFDPQPTERKNIHKYFRGLTELIVGPITENVFAKKRLINRDDKRQPQTKKHKSYKWTDVSCERKYAEKSTVLDVERMFDMPWGQFFQRVFSKIEQKINTP